MARSPIDFFIASSTFGSTSQCAKSQSGSLTSRRTRLTP